MRRRLTLAALIALILAATACGGGAGDNGAGEPLDQSGAATGERPVQFVGAEKAKLAGTLAVPDNAASSPSAPAVLIVPTTGPGDRNGPINPNGEPDPFGKDLAATFTNAGMPSYRYDRRGTGESALDSDTHLSLDDLVADARGGLDVLAQRKETAGRDLTVVGYDTGGLIALRLAAAEPRVKRLVLVSTPGQSVAEPQAATFGQQYGPESADAFRTTVANLVSTHTLPPLNELRSEFRSLLPPQEAPFLADLYSLDPAADASRVKARTLIVVPRDPVPYQPGHLAAAIPGSALLISTAPGPTLLTPAPPAAEDSMDPNSPAHMHGPPGVSEDKRDEATLARIVTFTGNGT